MDLTVLGSALGVITLVVGIVIGVRQIRLAQRQIALAERPASLLAQSSKRQDLLDRILSKRLINVGVFSNPPLVSVQRRNTTIEVEGVYSDIMRAIATKYNIEVNWIALRVCDLENAIQSGQVECILFVFQTAVRAKYADFTAIMHSVNVNGVVRQDDNRIRSQVDLRKAGIRLVVCRGEIGHEFAQSTLQLPQERLAGILETDNIPAIADLLQHNRADIALADGLSCVQAVKQAEASGPPLKIVFREPPLATCHAGVMIPTNQPRLLKWLDKEFQAARNDPNIKARESTSLHSYKGIVRRI